MKEPYEKGVANHLDPESWGLVREDESQALTGARVGRAIEPRNLLPLGRRGCSTSRRQHYVHRHREVNVGPTRSETPSMLGSISTEPGRSRDPSAAEGPSERKGKSKDRSPR